MYFSKTGETREIITPSEVSTENTNITQSKYDINDYIYETGCMLLRGRGRLERDIVEVGVSDISFLCIG